MDTRIDQIDHRKATLPELARLRELTDQLRSKQDELVRARTAEQDVQTQVRKSDADVRLVRDRRDRTQSRLDAGQGSSKDLQGMQHELESLARRQGELEDVELEVMERAEELGASVRSIEADTTSMQHEVDTAKAGADSTLADLDTERSAVSGEREQLQPALDADLITLYDKIRASSGGLGAAPLIGRRCGGCQLELNQTDLSRMAAAAVDEVLRCEECRRILVRTKESVEAVRP